MHWNENLGEVANSICVRSSMCSIDHVFPIVFLSVNTLWACHGVPDVESRDHCRAIDILYIIL